MKSESETIVANLLHEVNCARNLFHSSLVRTITCEQPFTLDDVISLLTDIEIWVSYKRAGDKKFLLRLEWNDY